MNKSAIDGTLKQIRGQDKDGRGRAAGDQLGAASGTFDRLIGILQEKYGYNRERAALELKRRVAKRQAR